VVKDVQKIRYMLQLEMEMEDGMEDTHYQCRTPSIRRWPYSSVRQSYW